MKEIVLVLFFVIGAFAQDSFENTGVRLALKIYDDCSKDDGLSPCLKKKAITFLDRLGRMDKLTLTDGVVVQKAPDAPKEGPAITEEQLEQTLPRSSADKDAALTDMLMDKITNFIKSRSIEVAFPKISVEELVEEGRYGDGGGKKKGGKKHMKGMMDMKSALMMGIAAKIAALVPITIGGIFFMAKKALIVAKIALLISGFIAIKKLLASKNGGGGGGGHGGGDSSGWQSGGSAVGGWQSGGGGGGGWQSGGGGWDKKSYNEAQNLAYNAYSPK